MWWIPKEKLIWSASFNKLDRFGELNTLLFLHPKRFNFSEWPIRLDQLALNGTQDCPGTNSAKLFSFVSTNGTVNYCYLFNRLYCRYKYRRHQLIFLYIWYTKLQKIVSTNATVNYWYITVSYLVYCTYKVPIVCTS